MGYEMILPKIQRQEYASGIMRRPYPLPIDTPYYVPRYLLYIGQCTITYRGEPTTRLGVGW